MLVLRSDQEFDVLEVSGLAEEVQVALFSTLHLLAADRVGLCLLTASRRFFVRSNNFLHLLGVARQRFLERRLSFRHFVELAFRSVQVERLHLALVLVGGGALG